MPVEECTVTVELRRTADDRIEGVVTAAGRAAGRPFSGWLEFLSLLEAAVPRRGATSEPGEESLTTAE